MSPRAESLPRISGAKKTGKKAATSYAWWPLLLGVLMTPVALKTAEVLPLLGGDGLMKLRMLYPFAMVVQQHGLGLAEQTANKISHILLFAQFPIYGFYFGAALRRKHFFTVLFHLTVVHAVAFCIASVSTWH